LAFGGALVLFEDVARHVCSGDVLHAEGEVDAAGHGGEGFAAWTVEMVGIFEDGAAALARSGVGV
jgi:hypothetical protein